MAWHKLAGTGPPVHEGLDRCHIVDGGMPHQHGGESRSLSVRGSCWLQGRRHVKTAVELAEANLAGDDQAVEECEHGALARQTALGLHPASELEVEPLDGIRGA